MPSAASLDIRSSVSVEAWVVGTLPPTGELLRQIAVSIASEPELVKNT